MKNIKILNSKSINAEVKKQLIKENESVLEELKASDGNELDLQATKIEKRLIAITNDIKQIKKRIDRRPQPTHSGIGGQTRSATDRSGNVCVIEPGSNVSYADAVKSVQANGNLINDKIRVTMSTTKSGKILVKCRSREERDRLMNNLNSEGSNVKSREAQGKFEKFVITRLPKNKIDGQPYTDDELEEEMLARRPDTNLLRASYKRLKSYDAKNGKRVFIISVNKEAAESIESDPYFFVGVESVKAQPKIDLIQCYRCQKYGHTTKDCCLNDDESICAKCADAGHRTKDCTSEEKKCICCERESLDGKGYCAMSDLCPIKRRERQREIASLRR